MSFVVVVFSSVNPRLLGTKIKAKSSKLTTLSDCLIYKIISVYSFCSNYHNNPKGLHCLLASVAKLDARPTGDQQDVGSNPPPPPPPPQRVGNIFSWRLIMK